MQASQESECTIQSLARKALALLKLVNMEILSMEGSNQSSNVKQKVKQAEESVEKLVSALQNAENLAVMNYESELETLEQEIDSIDWDKYQEEDA